MSLSSAINTAQTIFNNTAAQTAIVSKNIANSGNADYNRRMAYLGTTSYGAEVVTIQRAQNDALFRQSITSRAQTGAQNRLLVGLEAIQSLLGGNDYETSPSKYLASFRDSLQTFASKPNDLTVAASTISEAIDTANSIKNTSAAVQDLRLQADKEIGQSVKELNELLAKFELANDAVKGATASGTDPNDALDQRDKLLGQISDIVGVSVVTRTNNDVVLYTNDGTVLFETKPRLVSFAPTAGFNALTTGNAIYIDGVPVNAGTGGNTTAMGKMSALLQLRDSVMPTFQAQLDEVARGLITIFAEQDQSLPATLPDMPGLFTWSGATVPAAGVVVPGLAASLSVNPALIPSLGGNPMLLRDGGINGAAYKVNTANNAGYSELLKKFGDGMQTDMSFDPSTEVDGTSSVMEFSTGSVGWLEQLRSSASAASDNKVALLSRTQEALSNQTGVSLDEELSLLLDLEQSYKASAKLVSAVDAMMVALLGAIN
ncbi:flagellar hook-associated protein FlgK [Pararhizobium sp.]|uniref:flagellar hook-associated protein FlgK n=1 Tax=Pararhizobium sp. TaxID=1977563 RepID=UPI00271E7EFC|nr:flagellar hook-associated protein FlgK [Pararhizobium sp.]MDO9418251.1 flagellar hook-associated protein FlgK [Pararhizobium sp.]